MYIVLKICIVVFLLYLFLIMPRLRHPDLTILMGYFYAHRGLHDGNNKIPENSLPAFQLAKDKGYGYELDVQLTKDRKVVVFHDETIDRVTDHIGNVRDYTFDDLQQIGLAGTNEHIPLFTDVLALMDGKAPIIVEIKIHENCNEVCTAVNAILKDYTGPYCIESFDPVAVQWYKKHQPDIIRGQLSTKLNKETKSHNIAYFLVAKLLVNFLGRPDFIAYECKYPNCFNKWLCCSVFGALPVTWVIRSQDELEKVQKYFKLFIFEHCLPINK